jgi:acetate kinase
MSKIILSINSGSSSLKISVYKTGPATGPNSDKPDTERLAEIQVDSISSPPQKLKYIRGSTSIAKGDKLSEKLSTQEDAFKYILKRLIQDKDLKEVQAEDDIAITCHRCVHGGDYTKPTEITKDTMHHLTALTELAPLHNGPALQIIRSCLDTLPKAKNVAYFDSQFHHSIPDYIKTYPIDQKIAKSNGLRKYGFHGVSYAFITRSVAEYLKKSEAETNIIACHLGSGASVCAIRGGKSVDTSMGLTPVSGLPGATRSGDIDPA